METFDYSQQSKAGADVNDPAVGGGFQEGKQSLGDVLCAVVVRPQAFLCGHVGLTAISVHPFKSLLIIHATELFHSQTDEWVFLSFWSVPPGTGKEKGRVSWRWNLFAHGLWT